MAGLCWMAVALVLSLSAGNSLAVVDQNELARIVFNIVRGYRPHFMVNGERESPMFSLAVSVPCNSESSECDINQVFKTDSAVNVIKKILDCDVYTGKRMVAATVLRWDNVLKQCPDKPVQWKDVLIKCNQRSMTWYDLNKIIQDTSTKQQCRDAVWKGRADHAEYRTLQDNIFNNLVNNRNKEDLLLFYVFSSPCVEKCSSDTHHESILRRINVINRWNNRAFVFSKIFKPHDGPGNTDDERRAALLRLGAVVGLGNIFRCDRNQCTSCSVSGKVAHYCVSDESSSTSG